MSAVPAAGWFQHPGFQGHGSFARADITPPIGVYHRNWGASRSSAATGIHQPLTATAMALACSADIERPCLLLSLDLGWWGSPQWEWDFRSQLVRGLGISPERLLIAMSHTHSGPALQLDRADNSIEGGPLLHTWYRTLQETCLAVCRRALETLEPGWLEFSSGHCDLATNRDYFETGGRAVCGFNPNLPADSTLMVGRWSQEDGTVQGTLVNYACHPTSLGWENSLISPDYPGSLRHVVEAATGVPCLFLQGASGDLAPREQYAAEPGAAERNGRRLGYAVLGILEGMLRPGMALRYAGALESGATLGLWEQAKAREDTTLRIQPVSIQLPLKVGMASLDALKAELEATQEGPLRERLQRRIAMRRCLGPSSEYDLSAACWRVGGVLFFALASEPDSVLQLALRAAFPSHAVLVGGLVNGALAYQPRRELFETGNYEAEQTPFAAGNLEATLEILIATGKQML